ncbi:MAG: hypothetical protein Q9213_006907 [Squamulea squamosa]
MQGKGLTTDSGTKLANGQDILLSTDLSQHTQYVTCYVMCDEIAGTMRYAELKPGFPASIFPSFPTNAVRDQNAYQPGRKGLENASRVPKKNSNVTSPVTVRGDQELFDIDVADADMFEAMQLILSYEANQLDFQPIESFEREDKSGVAQTKTRNDRSRNHGDVDSPEWAPTQLDNGKWACNHKCKDKKACKHLCCHEGVDKPPKAPKRFTATTTSTEEPKSKPILNGHPQQNNVQSKLHMERSKVPNIGRDVETVNLVQKRDPNEYAKVAPQPYRSLHRLHEKVNKDNKTTLANSKPSFSYKKGEQPTFTFLNPTASSGERKEEYSSDYGSGGLEDLPSPSELLRIGHERKVDLDIEDIDYDNGEIPRGYNTFDSEHHERGGNGGYPEDPQTLCDSDMDAAVFADTEYEKAMANLESEGRVEVSPYFQGAQPQPISNGANHDKLFMSTDSPQKPSSPLLMKRKAPESVDEGLHEDDLVREGKKQKSGSTYDSAARQPTPSKENQASTPAPTIKPGHPAWVYEFDPAFIAEWEPYAEFV